ncbi:MAG TPA: nucleotide exchange factor GrpE [Nocardioidaceae bacterium]|nr:nucleotide exchange factor GrpE [Nocardioidaceae bacterium]
MTFDDREHDEHTETGPVIRDKRRIDPVTGEIREPRDAAPGSPASSFGTGSANPESTSPSDIEAKLTTELAERTSDLQRLQAEYVNYKRRVDRDREAVRQTAVANVLGQLLPALDDIGRAREHDELNGGFKAVAESLERTVSSLGLETFGEVGDRFDPRVHEALMHRHSDDVGEPVCEAVLQVGYRLGDRIIRPARVAVAEPENYVPEPIAAAETTAQPSPADDAKPADDAFTGDDDPRPY